MHDHWPSVRIGRWALIAYPALDEVEQLPRQLTDIVWPQPQHQVTFVGRLDPFTGPGVAFAVPGLHHVDEEPKPLLIEHLDRFSAGVLVHEVGRAETGDVVRGPPAPFTSRRLLVVLDHEAEALQLPEVVRRRAT